MTDQKLVLVGDLVKIRFTRYIGIVKSMAMNGRACTVHWGDNHPHVEMARTMIYRREDLVKLS